MVISSREQLTKESRFFLEPEKPLHRQYEALRAYFVEQRPSAEVAAAFGYTPGSFRVLCHTFRHERNQPEHYFREPQPGPRSAPVRDRVRDLAVGMRKRNLSVYDIQRELRHAGHEASINSLTLLLREEGFARLPRRADDERPDAIKPETAAVADVRCLSLAPRTFRTRAAGLFLFVPLMHGLDLARVAKDAALPGTKMVPAEHALRSMLALKLIGRERKSHVMSMVLDEGLALFAGLNAIPKRSYLAAYSSKIGRKGILQLMDAWFRHVGKLGIVRSGSLDLDYHTVPANTQKEPLQRHYVSRRSRRQQGILVFLARDAEERVLCYSNAGVTKEKQADEILRFVEFWEQETGAAPQELVFDSQLTTYRNLTRLDAKGIRFLTLRRRSKKMLAELYSKPGSAWQRVTLENIARAYRTPKVLDERIKMTAYGDKDIRQISIMDLGHEEPTILLTNDLRTAPSSLIGRYAHRMLIENGIAEAIDFFHLDALSSMVGLKVDFDLQITLMASSLYRLMAKKLADEYHRATAKKIFDNLLDTPGSVQIDREHITVKLDKHAHNPFLVDSGLAAKPTPVPWLGNRELVIQFA
jgi:hypothetical protein